LQKTECKEQIYTLQELSHYQRRNTKENTNDRHKSTRKSHSNAPFFKAEEERNEHFLNRLHSIQAQHHRRSEDNKQKNCSKSEVKKVENSE
jgi:hypothetical protein